MSIRKTIKFEKPRYKYNMGNSDCPVPANTKVEIVCRKTWAGSITTNFPSSLRWRRYDYERKRDDILFYRVIE